MNSSPAVMASNLGKMYLLYKRPEDRLKQSILGRLGRNYARSFWALRNITMEVRHGEVLGIVGRNGSGKSTLLQVIAGILQPTEGLLQVNGRLAALLELGAGFNPEFTGRENIFLNGATLGLSEKEMRSKLDAIIDFAQIGQFIDQPVKLYSSGMYVRLAFSIATSVDPEVLIIDEALAVGDAYFQQKCYRRMREFKQSGKAILFVTHDAGAVKSLCDRAVWLEDGELRQMGDPGEVVSEYLAFLFGYQKRSLAATALPASAQGADASLTSHPKDVDEPDHESLHTSQMLGTGMFSGSTGEKCLERVAGGEPETLIPNVNRRYGDGRVEILGIGLYDANGQRIASAAQGQTIQIRISIRYNQKVPSPTFGYILRDRHGLDLASTNTDMEGAHLPPGEAGALHTVRFRVQLPVLAPGPYALTIGISDGDFLDYVMCDCIESMLVFEVLAENVVYALMRFPTVVALEEAG
jgi:lipopolysaccharide transport system ATP-binding protein